MRDGWEIKKLGEVCTIKGRIGFRGYTREDLVAQGEGAITLSPSNIINDVLTFDKCQYISWFKYEESPEIQIFNGDIIYAKTASIGKVALVNDLPEKATINPQFVVFKDIKCHSSYLYYAVKGENFKHQISLITNGVAIPTVSQNNMANLLIPVPPLAEQEHIVQELDLLSGIIEKQKQQLKEYDTLAQSIFYDMFGDPITNEKGWEVLAIDNVCSSIVRGPFGSTLKKDFFVEPSNDTYKVYEQKHAIQKNATIGTYYISSEMFKALSRFEVKNGDIIMSCSGTIGEFYEIPNGAEKGIMNQALLKFTINSLIHKSYFLYTMEWVKENFEKKGSGLQNIGSVKTIKETSISIPPLTLQQEFAEKIEAIEKQKELIKQSLAETETLFNSRMEYYFN